MLREQPLNIVFCSVVGSCSFSTSPFKVGSLGLGLVLQLVAVDHEVPGLSLWVKGWSLLPVLRGPHLPGSPFTQGLSLFSQNSLLFKKNLLVNQFPELDSHRRHLDVAEPSSTGRFANPPWDSMSDLVPLLDDSDSIILNCSVFLGNNALTSASPHPVVSTLRVEVFASGCS